jgi:hypothetical protein
MTNKLYLDQVFNYEKRPFIVYDGVPFYKSTGENSGLVNTWFPTPGISEYKVIKPGDEYVFTGSIARMNQNVEVAKQVFIGNTNIDTKELAHPPNISSNITIDNARLKLLIDFVTKQYHEDKWNDPSSNQTDLNVNTFLFGRFTTIENLLISRKLGGGIWEEQKFALMFNYKTKSDFAKFVDKVFADELKAIPDFGVCISSTPPNVSKPNECNEILKEHNSRFTVTNHSFNERTEDELSEKTHHKLR